MLLSERRAERMDCEEMLRQAQLDITVVDERAAMGGGKENFVDKSLLFGLNLLSLYYTMEHRIHH